MILWGNNRMPFPRTWSEELLAEWLQIEGYFVETGIPIRSGSKGGRSEADVLGVRMKDDVLEIFHIEVGSLSGNPRENAEMIQKKFSQFRVDAITEYCKSKLKSPQPKKVAYKKLYVAVWWSDKTMNHLKALNLPVRSLMSVINNDIKLAVKNWKENPPHLPQTRGKSITLPENMWLLYLMNYLLEEWK
jgi:hypothetical protein